MSNPRMKFTPKALSALQDSFYEGLGLQDLGSLGLVSTHLRPSLP